MAANRVGKQHKIPGLERSLTLEGKTSIFHDQINSKCSLVMPGARFISVIRTANKSNRHGVGRADSGGEFAPVGIKYWSRDSHRCFLSPWMTGEQDISEMAGPGWRCSEITHSLLKSLQIVAHKGRCKHWSYRNILCWRAPDIRDNESESHACLIVVVGQRRCDQNINVDPRAISIPHHFQLRAGSLGLRLQSVSILLKDFCDLIPVFLQRGIESISVIKEHLLVIQNQLSLSRLDAVSRVSNLSGIRAASVHFVPLKAYSSGTDQRPDSDDDSCRDHYAVRFAYFIGWIVFGICGGGCCLLGRWWINRRSNGWLCLGGCLLLFAFYVILIAHVASILVIPDKCTTKILDRI